MLLLFSLLAIFSGMHAYYLLSVRHVSFSTSGLSYSIAPVEILSSETGTKLTRTDHRVTLAKQLEKCDSVESITAAIQRQARGSAQETR
jgi:hypothetical protein